MNQRIKELALQCGAWHQVYDPKLFQHDPKFDIEKFAELIIKETLQVARAGVEYGNGMEDAVYMYFGVER